MALLIALGFTRRRLLALQFYESGVALAAGLGAGFVAAWVAILSGTHATRHLNFVGTVLAFGCILLVGFGSQVVAAAVVGRRVRPADLRQE